MNLTSHQIQAIRDGEPVPVVPPEIGQECVLLRKDIFERIAALEGPREVSPEEFEAGLDALAEGCDELPVLPPDAYRRESIYGDQ